MKKWRLQLEVDENEDEFFQSLDYANQHEVLKNFILDVLHANGFKSKIRLNQYTEDYGDTLDFEERKSAEAVKANTETTS